MGEMWSWYLMNLCNRSTKEQEKKSAATIICSKLNIGGLPMGIYRMWVLEIVQIQNVKHQCDLFHMGWQASYKSNLDNSTTDMVQTGIPHTTYIHNSTHCLYVNKELFMERIQWHLPESLHINENLAIKLKLVEEFCKLKIYCLTFQC